MTDADREAAAKLISDYWHGDYSPAGQGMKRMAESYRNGHTQGVWVQAFARHREASIAPYVEALRALVKDFRWRSRMCRTNADAFDTKAAAVWDFAADAVQAQIDALLENGHD